MDFFPPVEHGCKKLMALNGLNISRLQILAMGPKHECSEIIQTETASIEKNVQKRDTGNAA